MRAVWGLPVLLAACQGLPRPSAWDEKEAAILPGSAAPAACVQVETEETGEADAVLRRRPFHVYDERGAFVTHFTNHLVEPVLLGPGRYVVVTRVGGVDRRVQIVVAPGRLSSVTLENLRRARAVSD
jgi:hypothetical protein